MCEFHFYVYFQCYFHRCHRRLVRLFTKSWIHFALFFLDWLLNAPTRMLHTYYGSIPLHLLGSRVFVCLFFPPTPLYNLLFRYSMQYLFARRSPATKRTELWTQRFFTLRLFSARTCREYNTSGRLCFGIVFNNVSRFFSSSFIQLFGTRQWCLCLGLNFILSNTFIAHLLQKVLWITKLS